MLLLLHDNCGGGHALCTPAPPQAIAAFIFLNFVLSVAATTFAVKAIDEIKVRVTRSVTMTVTMTVARLCDV